MSEHQARVSAYLDRRDCARGIDTEHIHGLDGGGDDPGFLLLQSDLRALLADLERAEKALAALAQQAPPVDRPVDPEGEINAAWSVIGAEQGSPRSVAFRDGAHWQRGQETKSLSDTSNQKAQEPFAYMDDDVAAGVLEGSVLLSAAIRGAPGGTFNFPLYTRPQQAQEPVQADAPRSCPDACRTPEKCCNFGCQKATPPAPQPAPVPEGYALISLDALMAWGKLDEVKSACVYPSTNPAPAPQVPAPVDELPDLNPEDIVVDVVLKQLGGFAPVTTHGVRVTHKPSLISVVVDSERSQHRNRQLALEALRAITHHQGHPAPSPQPTRHLTVTTVESGEAVMVSWQDEDHRILEVVWERKESAKQPAVPVDEQMTPSFAQLKQILDSLDRCHHRDSKAEFLRTWIRNWAETKVSRAILALRPAVEPMTNEQIEAAITKAVRERKLSWAGFRKDDKGAYTLPVLSPADYQAARAIEVAHGITAKSEGGA